MYQNHFISFIESLKRDNNTNIINTILEGYQVIIEAQTHDKDAKNPDGSYVSYSKTNDPSFDEDGYETPGEDYVLIDKVFVPKDKRGQGTGKKIIKQAIHEIMNSEDKNLDIRLSADPFDGGMDQEKLVKFYEKLGFSVDDYVEGMPGVMMTYTGKDPGIQT